jgi:PadR family transcriptional regulator PadR
VKSEAGPYRKYYKITDEGLVHLREFKHSYYKITGIVEKILEDKE